MVGYMQWLLFTLFIFQGAAAAIQITFVKESATNPITELELVSQNQYSSPRQPDVYSCLADLPENISRLVNTTVAAALTQDDLERNMASPVTVPLRCNGDWKYAKAVLRIVDGTAKELPTEMTETEAGRTQLIDIYHALLIQDFHYTKRFVDALCITKDNQTGIFALITYIKMWLRVFCTACNGCGARDFNEACKILDPQVICGTCKICDARDFVPDDIWLDLFQALRARDPMWYLLMKDFHLIRESIDLSPCRLCNTTSQFISVILQLLNRRECGLSIPQIDLLEGGLLAGRFSEVVDLVRCASNEDGVIFVSTGFGSYIKTRESFSDPAPMSSYLYNLPLSIRIMKNRRLFVGAACYWSPKYMLKLIRTLLTESAGQITDLFLNITLGNADFLSAPITDTTDVISTFATLPLRTVWVYSNNYRPHFVEEVRKQLCCLKQLKEMHNARVTVWEHRPLTVDETIDAKALKFEACDSCNDKKQPCFVDWCANVEEHTCKPAYILPLNMNGYSNDKPFMLAGLAPTSDKTSLVIEERVAGS